ncbi:TetR/AcrR family transcriptional regulator [Gordonia crocea]|uniref:HTH tetR-type domain-containing protein n=1 Tax=Gordonia crocea TaxID=589162 RepID=A0A7M3SVH6_9ACTN|nr:TetR/AcrR family transcriptional regulator [Gordonia crocea]GED96650.1 hypothetical protein nbrc107697_06890 [Gordonia crocea]
MARASRRNELLDAALAEWASRGYAAIGVKEITARAEVSHGTFYNYFENRRQMLDVLIQREMADYLEILSASARDIARPVTDDSLHAEITRVSSEILRRALRETDDLAFILLDVAGIDDDALQGQIELFRDAGRRAQTILASAVADGVIDESVSLEFAGQAWISAILGLLAPVVADGRDLGDIDSVARVLADALLHGVPVPVPDDAA